MARRGDWHELARYLRKQGMSVVEIAREVHHAQSTVAWVLDLNGERAKQLERVRRNRRERKQKSAA